MPDIGTLTARMELNYRELSSGIKHVERRLDGLGRKTRKTEKTVKSSFGSMGTAVRAFASTIAFIGLVNVGRDAVRVASQIDSLNRAFKVVTGSTESAAKEFKWLRHESDRLGQNFYSLAEQYKGFLAASVGTRLEGEATREIFIGVSSAATALGLSAEQTRGALYAVQQMMNKGKITAEELRQQLGERLPGAAGYFATAMGVSLEEFNKLLDNGEVALDVLPKVAQILEDRFGKAAEEAIEGPAAKMRKFQEAVTELKVALYTGGFIDSLIVGMDKFRDVVSDQKFLNSVEAMGEGMGALVEASLELEPAITSVASALGLLSKVVKALPSEAVSAGGMGLVGYVMFGARGGAVGVAIAATAWAIGRVTENLQRLRDVFDATMAGVKYTDNADLLNARIKDSQIMGGAIQRGPVMQDNLADMLTPMSSRPTAEVDEKALKKAKKLLDARLAMIRGFVDDKNKLTMSESQYARFALEQEFDNMVRAEEFQKASIQERKKVLDAWRGYRAAKLQEIADDEKEAFNERRTAIAEFIAESRDLREESVMSESQLLSVQTERAMESYRKEVEYKEATDAEKRIIDQNYAQWYAEKQKEITEMQKEEEYARLEGAEKALQDYINSAQDFATQFEDAMGGALSGLEDSLTDFVSTGKLSFADLADSIVKDLSRIAVRTAITGPLAQGLMGSGLTGGIGSILSGTMGFASGGSFTVGADSAMASVPGVDNRLVAFRARDGEQVTVSPPGQGGGGSQVVFNIQTPDADSFRRSQGQIMTKAQAALSRAHRRNG